jgi:CO/xanthine dehydrogenase Mo-binding subunit
VPEIDTVLVDNPDLAPQGCGEPSITCVAPMIANALFDATGVRICRLPLTPELVKARMLSLSTPMSPTTACAGPWSA